MIDLRIDAVGRLAASRGDRFAFGENWQSFAAEIDEARILEAEKSLQRLVGRERFYGLRFLDIGSGSGLSSLAARRLGALVYSLDYDESSADCTQQLHDRYYLGDSGWQVSRGSVLDCDYLAKLGTFDIVYAWGVLHHTGAMLQAIENASKLVAPGGLLVMALYRKTRLCRLWRLEKRWYCRTTPRAQSFARGLYVAMTRLAFALRGRNFREYVSEYRSRRGMNFTHDVHDWLGGYPYESIQPAEVAREMDRLGLTHVHSNVRPYAIGLLGSGCDEYVYRRSS